MLKRLAALLLLLCPAVAIAQPSPQNPQVQSVQFQLSNPPLPVSSASVSLTGNPGPRTVYFWIVSNYSIGNASVAGPYALPQAPNAFTGSNYATVSWAPALGASTYDLLMTLTISPPKGACNCAVATAISGVSQNVTSETLNSYTVASVDVNQYGFTEMVKQYASGKSSLSFITAAGLEGYQILSDGTVVLPRISGSTQCLHVNSVGVISGTGAECGSGTGSVTSFSSGNLPPLFATTVGNPTTTPALAFALSNAAANTLFGNFTSLSTAPSFNVMSACGDDRHALSWVAGTGFSCQLIGSVIGYTFSQPGAVPASAVGLTPISAASTLPANLTSTNATTTCQCGTNPTSSFVVTFKDGSAAIATATLDSSCNATLATTGGTAQMLAVNDQLYAYFPAVADATAANISCILRACRGSASSC